MTGSILQSANGMLRPLIVGGVILLIVLMALREATSSLRGEWGRFSRYLNVAIVPLLVAFALTIVTIIINFVRNPPPPR